MSAKKRNRDENNDKLVDKLDEIADNIRDCGVDLQPVVDAIQNIDCGGYGREHMEEFQKMNNEIFRIAVSFEQQLPAIAKHLGKISAALAKMAKLDEDDDDDE